MQRFASSTFAVDGVFMSVRDGVRVYAFVGGSVENGLR